MEPVLSRRQAIAVADRSTHLNQSQKSVVEDVLSSPDRIQGLQGFAGSGKTGGRSLRSAVLPKFRATRYVALPQRRALRVN